MTTIKRIIRDKSTGQSSAIQFVVTLLYCLLSAWYGIPFVSRHNFLVTVVNGTGAIIQSIYLFIFIIYAPQKERCIYLGLFTFVLVIFSTVACVSMFAMHGHARRLLCGIAYTIAHVLMYASPILVMRMVIKTKRVESIPFLLSLFVFLSRTSWFIFGILGGDLFIAVPNSVGFVIGVIQLLLYLIYRNKKGPANQEGTQPVEEDGQSMEDIS